MVREATDRRRPRLRLRDLLRPGTPDDLPPGQRAVVDHPRFSDKPWRALPDLPAAPTVHVSGAVAHVTDVTLDELRGLERREQTSTFSCVTTWSVRGLRWAGVPFRTFYDELVVPRCAPSPAARWLRVIGLDGSAAIVALEDALGDDVLLADELDGAPLTLARGAPLRLVSPSQYAYKSVKHVAGIELCVDQPASTTGAKEHPRARVALEERHRVLPAWLVRVPYRLIAPVTALLGERSARTGTRPSVPPPPAR